MTHIDKLARYAASFRIKVGAQAAGCAFRFKTIADPVQELGDVASFAQYTAAFCAFYLGARDDAAVPAVHWIEEAGGGEKAAYGSDRPINGFAERDATNIFLLASLPKWKLAEVVAHETCHAVNHRRSDPSAETEREAYDFGWRVAAKFNLVDDLRAELFVVDSADNLPRRAPPFSTAMCVKKHKALYRAVQRGFYEDACWGEYLRFDAAAFDGGALDTYERRTLTFTNFVWPGR